MSAVTMADLTPGTRVRHLEWLMAGTIRVTDGLVSIRWDDSFVEDEISTEGVVFPSDVEIIQEGP